MQAAPSVAAGTLAVARDASSRIGPSFVNEMSPYAHASCTPTAADTRASGSNASSRFGASLHHSQCPVSTCWQGCQWHEAPKLLSEMQAQRLEPTLSLTVPNSTYNRGCRWHEAQKLLSGMQAQRLEPSIVTHSAAISACEQVCQ